MNIYQKKIKNEIRDIIFFFLLGIVLSFIPNLLVPYFLILNIYFIIKFNSTNDLTFILQLIFILPSVELTRRILGVNLLPFEIGKYMSIFYFLIITFSNYKVYKSSEFSFILILFLIIPSIFLIDFEYFQKKIVFSFLGILNLGILGILFSKLSITINQLKSIFKIFVLTSLPVAIILTIKTPDFDEIDFGLGANFETSGGFGPNQVSTYIGSVIFIIIINQIVFKSKIFEIFKYFDFVILFVLALRIFLTFSRGGVLSLFGAILIPINLLKNNMSGKLYSRIILISVFSVIPFYIINEVTEGALLLRFQGETRKTLDGKEEKDLEIITSGRSSIIENDLQIWYNHLIYGVGPGQSSKFRNNNELDNIQSHTEFSRLLAEHGILGLFVTVLIVIIFPLKIYFSRISLQSKYIKLTFVLIAIFSMTHSAMRTVVPFLFYAFGAINIVENKTK